MSGKVIDSNAETFETLDDILIDGDIVTIQVDNLSSNAVIDVKGKLHADAQFKSMFTIRQDEKPTKLLAMPIMKLILRKNTVGNTVKVWVL